MKIKEETRRKMAESHMGKKHSAATKEKIRQTMRERAALIKAGWLPRFHHSTATKEKLRRIALEQGRKPNKVAQRKMAEYQQERRNNQELKDLLKQNK